VAAVLGVLVTKPTELDRVLGRLKQGLDDSKGAAYTLPKKRSHDVATISAITQLVARLEEKDAQIAALKQMLLLQRREKE
jgi:hypothetical protein